MSELTIDKHTWGQWTDNEAITAGKMNAIEKAISNFQDITVKGEISASEMGNEDFTRTENYYIQAAGTTEPTFKADTDHDVWVFKKSKLNDCLPAYFYWSNMVPSGSGRHGAPYLSYVIYDEGQLVSSSKDPSLDLINLSLTDNAMIYLSITRENDIAARVGLGKLYYNRSYITPYITIDEITDGHEVKIKDIYGEHKFTVINGPQGLQGDKGDSYILTTTDKQEIASIIDDITLSQLKLDSYPLSILPELTIYQNKKCSSYNTETFVPAEFTTQDGQDIYVFKVADLIADGITSLSFPDMRAAGGVGQSFILWKAGVFATNTAGTITDGVRTVSFASYTNAEYMLICFLHENAWLRFSKDYSEETIDRNVKGWLRPDDLDKNSRKVLTDTSNTITALSFDLPFTLTSQKFISTNYNDVHSSPDMDTIGNGQYYRYWWSKWIDIRGVDKIRLNTILTNSSGYAFCKGDQLITIGGVVNDSAYKLYTYWIDVPEGAEYFAFTCSTYQQTEAIAQKISNGTYSDIINATAFSTGAFINRNADGILQAKRNAYPPYEMLLTGKTLCIGDSLTIGSKPRGSKGYSGLATPYYTRLATIGNFPDDINALAQSGYTASEWYERYSQTDFTAYNNYLIWLGTNNGPTTEPAAKMADETEGTETYYYRKIIEDIIAANAGARIFLCSVFASKDSVPIVNDCIRQIAALYPANVMGVTNFDDGTLFGEAHVDLHYVPDGTEINGAMTNGTENNPHFNEGGYFVVATKWLSEIRRLIRENIVKF